MTTAPLFLVDDVASLPGPGSDTVLDGPEGRHAATVRRLRPGEALVLSDGRGGLARAEVVDVAGRDALTVRLHEVTRVPAPEVRVVVAQALVKGDRGELAVETATEAGATGSSPGRRRAASPAGTTARAGRRPSNAGGPPCGRRPSRPGGRGSPGSPTR